MDVWKQPASKPLDWGLTGSDQPVQNHWINARVCDVLSPPDAPLPPRQSPEPLTPRRKQLEGTPAGPAPFPAGPFLQAVAAVAEQEGSDGLQGLLRERYPAVMPGDAEGYLVAIRAHLRALLQDDGGTGLDSGDSGAAGPSEAMPQQKPLAGSGAAGSGGSVPPAAASASSSAQWQGLGGGKALAGSQRRRLEGAFGEALPDVRLHRDAEAARLSRSLGARAFTYRHHAVLGAQ